MLLEKDCRPDEKFLPIFGFVRLSDLPNWEQINSFGSGDKNTVEIKRYLNWQKTDNELLSYNGYGYCDTALPKKYDYLIDLSSDKGGNEIDAIITQNIWNGIVPIGSIDHGHKTFGVIDFPDGIPSILDNLKYFKETDFKLRFALCSKLDKDVIINKLKNDS